MRRRAGLKQIKSKPWVVADIHRVNYAAGHNLDPQGKIHPRLSTLEQLHAPKIEILMQPDLTLPDIYGMTWCI